MRTGAISDIFQCTEWLLDIGHKIIVYNVGMGNPCQNVETWRFFTAEKE